MLALGLALAALIGLSLGLLGGGGSILTVPVLVYVLGFAAKPAIAMSLPVVGDHEPRRRRAALAARQRARPDARSPSGCWRWSARSPARSSRCS